MSSPRPPTEHPKRGTAWRPCSDTAPGPLPTPEETRRLLQRCLAGESEAWERLVARFSRLVLSSVGRTFVQFDRSDLSGMEHDVGQDVFLSLLEDDYRVLRTLRDPARFPGWLAAVARNKAVDALRRTAPTPTPLGELLREAAAVYASPEAREADAARKSLAQEALGVLEPGDRLLIELFYFERLRYRDIAQMLGIPENTVGSRLYRIKRRLLKRLGDRRTEGGRHDRDN